MGAKLIFFHHSAKFHRSQKSPPNSPKFYSPDYQLNVKKYTKKFQKNFVN